MPASPPHPIAPLDEETVELLLGGRLAPEDAPVAYAEDKEARPRRPSHR